MKLEKEFFVKRDRKSLIEALEKDETFGALFPDTTVKRVTNRCVETLTPFQQLGQDRDIRFVFDRQPDGNVRFHKVCDGNVWRSLEGEVRLEGNQPDLTRVRLLMQGTTRALVPEFTIRGPMQEQIQTMADSLRTQLEQA